MAVSTELNLTVCTVSRPEEGTVTRTTATFRKLSVAAGFEALGSAKAWEDGLDEYEHLNDDRLITGPLRTAFFMRGGQCTALGTATMSHVTTGQVGIKPPLLAST